MTRLAPLFENMAGVFGIAIQIFADGVCYLFLVAACNF